MAHIPIRDGKSSGTTFGIDVEQSPELKSMFNNLIPKMRDKAIKIAFTEAAKVVQEKAVLFAPKSGRKIKMGVHIKMTSRKIQLRAVKESGILRKSLTGASGRHFWKNRGKTPALMTIGPSRGKYARPYNAWYAIYPELGTKRYGKKAPKTGYRYMQKAWQATKERAFNIIKFHILNAVD